MSETPPFESRRAYRPGLVFQPTAQDNIRRGIHTLVAAIRPTLGPTARTVAVTPLTENKTLPEVLDDGGTIARRVIELEARDRDMGAMLARALICRQSDRMGDGTATAAVLLGAIVDGGARYLAAGGDAMRLRYYLEEALALALAALEKQTKPVNGKVALARVAESICADSELAALLGEIFDIIGAYGQLDIRADRGRRLRREYVEGMTWDGGVFARDMIQNSADLQTVYEEPALVLADFKVNDPRHIMPMLELAVDQEIKRLILVAADLGPSAIAGLMMANGKLKDFQVMAVRGPGKNADDRLAAMEDIAVATGAIPLIESAGDTLRDVTPAQIGRARRGWASTASFGIIGGKGDPRQLRRHLSGLQGLLENSDDAELRQRLTARIGRLMGGSATLWIGGASSIEIDARKEVAIRTAAAMRAAVTEGVVPGGGSALMRCGEALNHLARTAHDPDRRAAYAILRRALAEPARAIQENAGYEPGAVQARLHGLNGDHSFDALRGEIIGDGKLVDPAAITKAALRNATLTAGMALTVDVLVHHKTPELARQPG